jgi:hypothetical protein
MRITSFGLFWGRDEIEFSPGRGSRDFKLLGRIGGTKNTIRVTDFRYQSGIYILFDDYGPTYVGLTRDQGLGKRLKDHTTDRHKKRWDRFSWFGFLPVAQDLQDNGVAELDEKVVDVSEDTQATIGDLEALLIQAMGTRDNRSKMKFQKADRWFQIDLDDWDHYLDMMKRVRCNPAEHRPPFAYLRDPQPLD